MTRVAQKLANLLTAVATAPGKDVEIVKVLSDDRSSVRIDAGTLERIIMHLGVHARFAMPGRGTITLETSKATPPGRECEVRDPLAERHGYRAGCRRASPHAGSPGRPDGSRDPARRDP